MITRSTSIVHLSFLAEGSASSSSDVSISFSFLAGGSISSSSDASISITLSADRWEVLIGLEDFDFTVIVDFTVLVHVQASLPPSDCLIFPSHDCLIFPSHGSTLVIADNAPLLMFLAFFDTLRFENQNAGYLHSTLRKVRRITSSTCYPTYYVSRHLFV